MWNELIPLISKFRVCYQYAKKKLVTYIDICTPFFPQKHGAMMIQSVLNTQRQTVMKTGWKLTAPRSAKYVEMVSSDSLPHFL